MSDFSQLNSPDVNTGPKPRVKTVVVNGAARIRVYSTGFAARIIGLAPVTIRLWERNGIFPRPLVKLPVNRWYTGLEIRTYGKLIRDHYQSGAGSKTQLAANLKAARKNLALNLSQLTTDNSAAHPLLVKLPHTEEQAILAPFRHKQVKYETIAIRRKGPSHPSADDQTIGKL
jgi:DNA-binding transcriptional MerR regulator